jgi:hypothetical protein
MDLFTYNDLDIVPDKESAFKITIYRLVKAGIVERLGLTTQMSNIIQIGANFDKNSLIAGNIPSGLSGNGITLPEATSIFYNYSTVSGL